MRKRAGFTLIELPIVMAIIAALMAVLIPTATGAMRKARATRLAVQLRNYVTGLQQWITATLPASDDVADLDVDNAVSMGFVGQAERDLFANGTDFNADAANSRIVITVDYDTNDSNIANLVYNSLKDVFAGGTGSATVTNDTEIGITAYVQAFWW
ncbi:type II secretion system protein [Thermotoga neapolitana]|nr:type II secretion system protein [Thermotoga neapolitana]